MCVCIKYLVCWLYECAGSVCRVEIFVVVVVVCFDVSLCFDLKLFFLERLF